MPALESAAREFVGLAGVHDTDLEKWEKAERSDLLCAIMICGTSVNFLMAPSY